MSTNAADAKCQLSIVDMVLNDTATLDVFDKLTENDDTDNVVNWDPENDNFLDSLLKMENDSTVFEFLSSSDDFMSSAASTPRSSDNAGSSSYSDSGLSSVDNMPNNPILESSKSDDVKSEMEFAYDSFIKEEIIGINDEEKIDDDNDNIKHENYEENYRKDEISLEEKPIIIQQSQLLETTPRTPVISPKQPKRSIAISKHKSKSVFIPIHLSNFKTIKVVRQDDKLINTDASRQLQSINYKTRIFVRNNGSMVSKCMPALKQTKIAMSDYDKFNSMYPHLCISNEERKLMEAEGIKIPSHYPLTKHEENKIKQIRRKIKNKISARNSRQKMKEYVKGLEKKVEQFYNDNSKLVKNIRSLRSENEQLREDLKRLKNDIDPGSTT